MNKLPIAFFGAPLFSARVLERILLELSETVTVQAVFTQPDKPAGRKQILTPTPLKLIAQKHSIPVFENLESSMQLEKVDLALLYAYGTLLPPAILKIPRWGFWNIHPSLLPRYRGASPIVYSLLMGDKTTGTSLIEMDKYMDHGPLLTQMTYDIQDADTRDELENRLSDIGYELFKQSVQVLIDGKLQKQKQDENNKTFTRLLTKKDGFIPFDIVHKIIKNEKLTESEIPAIIMEYSRKYPSQVALPEPQKAYYHLFRSFSPWPGIWTTLKEGKRLKITQMQWKEGRLYVSKVQLEGKKEVDFETFNAAYKVFV